MEVNCARCAGCCIDWRSLASDASDHERRGRHSPFDDQYNFVPLTRDDVIAFVESGYVDAMTPRLWADESGVEIDGTGVAAIDDKPVFFLGLRKPPKPVAPFGEDPSWLPTCVFLDPMTLQCRIHESDLYPEECEEYPGHNLELGAETECERVENAFGGDRLIDGTPPSALSGLLLGPQAVGQKVFVHPDPDRLTAIVTRVTEHAITPADRIEFVAAAIANSPGTTTVDRDRFSTARQHLVNSTSWVTQGIDSWHRLAESEPPDPSMGERVEEAHGAPPTPGWPTTDR